MNKKRLPLTQFTKLNATTKDLINMGEWFLYEISYTPIPSASYYLSTDQMSFFISDDGTVIEKTPITPEDLKLNTQIVFSDLPEPQYIFSWITNPIDIDGDGKLSVMDSFKYAAINTNLALAEIKKKDNFQSIVEQSILIKCLKKMQDDKIPEEDKNNLFLERQSLEKILETRYIIQEPWILNAPIAMNTDFF